MTLDQLLKKYKDDVEPETLTFGEYYERVLKEPALAQLSHARLYGMLTEKSEDGTAFFKDTIFGADKAISQFAALMKSASRRMEIRKRIILLMGPPGAGKSTMVAQIKRGLEEYTLRHPLYAIAECPIHEEPLHLLPAASRGDLAKKNVYIEGGLCPYCEQVVKPKYAGNIASVPVRRMSLSETRRRGVGTFAASDSKNQSVDDLVGAVNIAKLTQFEEDDPRAYSYNGEIQVANRGALELIEIFKANQELLWIFLDVTQEMQVKTSRQAYCPVDLVILAHTNQAEFDKFQSDPKNEALRDRIVPIRVPYTLAVTDEMKIYRKLLEGGALEGVHVPETSLRVAAQFAVLTRLTESDRLRTSDENKSGLIKKMKLYDGQKQQGFTPSDVKALHEESPNEGMDGFGPRQVINALSIATVGEDKQHNPVKCLTPILTLRTLSETIKDNIQLSQAARDAFLKRLGIGVELFADDIKVEVQKGFVHGFGDAAASMFARYVDNVTAYLNEEKVENPITQQEEEPNERFMRRIEEMIDIHENQAKTFRQEIFAKMGKALREGRTFDYASHPTLKEGIEKALFADLKDAIAVTTSQSQNPDSRKRFNEVVESMKELGWCPVCASEAIKYVGDQLS